MLQRYGAYALLAGLVIAVVVGLIPKLDSDWMRVVLVILGLVGGALNVRSEKTTEFLVAGIALMLAASVRSDVAKLTSAGKVIELSLRNVYMVTAAASLVLAVKTIVSAAMERHKE